MRAQFLQSTAHRYLWGTKQDELICDNDNWTLCDHLNTIRDIVKSDGTVTDHLEYNSFGKIISATKNDSSLQFAYTGKLTDKESDLQWNINRWYDTKVGRWVSEDPIGFKSKDKNLLRYTYNSPILFNDYSGKYGTILAIASGGLVIAGHVGTTVTFATIFADFLLPNTSFTIQSSGSSSTIAYIATGEFDTNIGSEYPAFDNFSNRFCPAKIEVNASVRVYESDSTTSSTALNVAKTVSFMRNKAADKFTVKFGVRLSLSCRNTTTSTCVTVTADGGTDQTEVCDTGGDVELYYNFKIKYSVSGTKFGQISSYYVIGGPEDKFIGTYTCI